MIIATYNSAEGSELDPSAFAAGLLSSGHVNRPQSSAVASTLRVFDRPINLHVEKIGRKLWVTVLSKRHVVWTWSIGAMGKVTAPSVDASEAIA